MSTTHPMTPLPSKHVLLKVLTFLVGDASLPRLLPPVSFAASSRSDVTSQVLHLPVPRLDCFPRPRRAQRPAQTSRSLRRPARSPPARRTGSPSAARCPWGGFVAAPVALLRVQSRPSFSAWTLTPLTPLPSPGSLTSPRVTSPSV